MKRIFGFIASGLIGVTVMGGYGCSQPATSSVGVAGEEIQQGVVGYNETNYVYNIKVPGKNQWVQMITEKPLPSKPTYEDYLKWKASQ